MRPFVYLLSLQCDDQGVYSHTTFLYRLNGRRYIMRCTQPDQFVLSSTVPEVLEELRAKEQGGSVLPNPGQVGGLSLSIDETRAFPKFDLTMTRAPANLGNDVFVKEMCLLDYVESEEHEKNKQYLLAEARVYEMMLASDADGGLNNMDGRNHICKYRGCVVERRDGVDYTVGLALDKLKESLKSRCQKPRAPLNVKRVVKEVGQALHYLHGLGYCHNDVSLQNIMVTEEDKAVLIDFDACRPDGAPLTKGALLGYKDPEQTKSSKENDWHGLNEVEKMLREVF